MFAGACDKDSEPEKSKASCGENPRKRIVTLKVHGGTHNVSRPVRIERKELRDGVLRALKRGGVFRVDLEEKVSCGEPHSLKVDLDFRQLVYEDKGRASMVIAITLQPLHNRSPTEKKVSRGEARQTYRVSKTPNLKSFYMNLLERGVRDVFSFIEVEERLRGAPPEGISAAIEAGALHTGIGSDPTRGLLRPSSWQKVLSAVGGASLPFAGVFASQAGRLAARQMPPPKAKKAHDIQETAITVAADRKLRECLPSLLHVIQFGAQQRLRDQALGALVEIGDRSVVPKLTRLTQFRDSEGVRRILEVVAQLGGPKAKAWLELTADGHPDRDVRKMAQAALKSFSR